MNIEYKDENLFHMKNRDNSGEYQVLRILVKNTGKKVLHTCEAKAEIYQLENNNEKLFREPAAILHWSRYIITIEEQVNIKEEFRPIIINKGDKEFLDVIKAYNEFFFLFSDRLFKNIGTKYGNGCYYIKLTIFSEDLHKPKVQIFKIKKKCGFMNINITKVNRKI